MVSSNRMPPASATTCCGIKMQMGGHGPSPSRLHLPLLSPTTSAGLPVPRLDNLVYFGLLQSLFLCLEIVPSRSFQGWSLRISPLLTCSSTGRPSLTIPPEKAVPTPLDPHVYLLHSIYHYLELFICLLVYCLSPPLETKIQERRDCVCHVHWNLSTQKPRASL